MLRPQLVAAKSLMPTAAMPSLTLTHSCSLVKKMSMHYLLKKIMFL